MSDHIRDVPIPTGIDKCIGYLKDRGIPDREIIRDECNIEITTGKDAKLAMGFKEEQDTRPTMLFRYPTDPILGDYCTARFIGKFISPWGTAAKKKQSKLMAPAGPVRAYVPEIINWDTFDGTLYLCESVIKSLVMAINGYAAIGGNGVDCLYTRQGWVNCFPIDLFESGAVKKVVVLFDNDYDRNPRVGEAIRRTAGAVQADFKVPCVHRKLLDPPEDSSFAAESRGKDQWKWGLDDAVGLHGVDWLREWLQDESYECPPDLSDQMQHFDEINEQYAYCRFPARVIDKFSANVYPVSEFYHLEAPREFTAPKGKGTEQKSAAKEWIKYQDRFQVESMDYIPGHPTVTDGCYNLHRDDGVVAKEGDVSVYEETYENLVQDKDQLKLLHQLIAYKIRHRDEMLNKLIYIVGEEPGIGKSYFADVVGTCFGDSNYQSIGVEDFTGDFNAAFVNKEIILLDDIQELPDKFRGKLKRYVTDRTLLMNAKHQAHIKVKNYGTFIMTSNVFGAIPMDEKDRRVFAIHFDPVVMRNEAEWLDYTKWLEKGGGYGAIRWWYENVVDLTGFNPNFIPKMTGLKKTMIEAGMEDMEIFMRELRVNPVAHVGSKRRYVSAKDICITYYGNEIELSHKEILRCSALIRKYNLFEKATETRFKMPWGPTQYYCLYKEDVGVGGNSKVRDNVESSPITLPAEKRDGKY